jgi:hypothetical protein
MSEHATKQHPTLPVIKRNDVELTFIDEVFGKKSPNAGRKFPCPPINQANWDVVSKWLGIEWLVSVAQRAARKIAADIYLDEANWSNLEVVKEGKDAGKIIGGTFLLENAIRDLEEFTAGVATLGDLADAISQIQDQMSLLVDDEGFAVDDKDAPLNPERYVELTEQMKDLQKKIRPIKQQYAAITAKYKERAEKRKLKEQASETKSAE